MRVVVSAPFVRVKGTGIARHLHGLLGALRPPAFQEIEFLVLWPPDEPWPSGFAANLRNVPLTIGTGGGKGHPLGRILREGAFVRRLFRQRPFDAFHSPFGYLPPALPVPAVVTLHDLRFLHYPASFSPLRGAFLRWAIPNSLRRAARTLTISEATRAEALMQVRGLDPARITVAYPGLDPFWSAPPDPAAVEAARQRLGRFVLAVGTTEAHKNLPRLIEAFVRLRSGAPALRLALAGETFASGKGERLMLPDGASALGRIDDEALRTLYAACAAYVYPSLYEGFGYPPLEALAGGAAVVASDIPPLREVLGDCARFAEPSDPESIADALEAALEDGADIAAGKARAGRYRWEEHAATAIEIYRSAAGQGK